MYLNLAFRIAWITYTRPVNITLNIGVLEDICTDLGIEFHQINEYIKTNSGAFTELLLYYGYLAGCKYTRTRPRYKKIHATRWANKMTVEESTKLLILMDELYGKLTQMANPDSKKKS